MLGHIRKCKKIPCNVDTRQSKIAFQPVTGGNNGDVSIVSWKFDQEECRKALCRMIILDELPFRFVEKEGFKQFMKVVQPLFRISSRTTVTRDCFDLFDEEKNKMRSIFKETQQRVCITTDTWTSVQRINYMCITAHWIDKNWTLHKRVINFCPISSHRGEDLAKGIVKCLHEWGLHQIFTVTVDNASSNNVCVAELSKQLTKWGTNLLGGKHLHVRCMAHIINLVVQDGIKEANISIERIRQAVRYIRWNSTYLMLNRAIEYEGAILTYADRDIGLAHYLEFGHICVCDGDSDIVDEEQPVGSLLCSDWDSVKRIAKFLELFFKLTLKVSGSLYITSNIHFLEICQVGFCLSKLISSDDIVLAQMATNMKKKFEKYWGDPTKMNKMLFIPCVLDPRHKFTTLSFALKKMFADNGATIEKDVREYMKSLFNEYSSSASKDKCGKLSSEVEASSSSSMVDIGDFYEELSRHTSESGAGNPKSELDKYLAEDTEVGTSDFNVLLWWKYNSARFSFLSEMARDILAIPISSVASECAFSTGGRVLDSFRSSLNSKLVEALVCLQDWLRSESKPISIEEDLDSLEQLEQALMTYSNLNKGNEEGLWLHCVKYSGPDWIYECPHPDWASLTTYLANKKQVHAILGPLTHQEAALFSDFDDEAFKGIPIISLSPAATYSTMLLAEPPSFIQMSGDVNSQMQCFAALIGHFKWRKVIALYEISNSFSNMHFKLITHLSDSLKVVDSSVEHHLAFPPLYSLSNSKSFFQEELVKLRSKNVKVFVVAQCSLHFGLVLF
ncbi:hypothetical protein P3S67_021716 [Capsicum chacoense]